MTEEFRKQRDDWMRGLYDSLIRQRKQPDQALAIVHKEQELKYGLSYIRVERICRRWKIGEPKPKERPT